MDQTMQTDHLSCCINGVERRTIKTTTSSVYDAIRDPDISMNDFAQRIRQYLPMTYANFSLAIHYVDITCKKNNISVTIKNFHRLFLAAFTISHKILDDEVYANKYIAKVCGITPHELIQLEKHMLWDLEFKLYADITTLNMCINTLAV